MNTKRLTTIFNSAYVLYFETYLILNTYKNISYSRLSVISSLSISSFDVKSIHPSCISSECCYSTHSTRLWIYGKPLPLLIYDLVSDISIDSKIWVCSLKNIIKFIYFIIARNFHFMSKFTLF